MALTWSYVRIGQCPFCLGEGLRLWTPAIEGLALRCVTAPRFCFHCRLRFEELMAKIANPVDIMESMERNKGRLPKP